MSTNEMFTEEPSLSCCIRNKAPKAETDKDESLLLYPTNISHLSHDDNCGFSGVQALLDESKRDGKSLLDCSSHTCASPRDISHCSSPATALNQLHEVLNLRTTLHSFVLQALDLKDEALTAAFLAAASTEC